MKLGESDFTHHSSARISTANKYQEPFGNIQMAEKKREILAYCSSLRCAGIRKPKQGMTIKPIVKKVSKSVNTCPDCLHTLFWK